MLRVDSALATQLLTAWCEATSRVEDAQISEAVARVIETAVKAGRVAEVGAAVMRALPGADDGRLDGWIAAWLAAGEDLAELAAMHRMLRAARAAVAGNPAALLALPAEERVAVQVIAQRERSEADARAD